MTNARILSASTLEGDKVVNPEGEELGVIKDVMIDVVKGTTAYYVLSFGGFLGVGDKLFAVPPQALYFDSNNNRFVLEVARDKLESAEGFDKSNWPNMADPDFADRVFAHYGYSAEPKSNSVVAS